jgi:hypothetical protein
MIEKLLVLFFCNVLFIGLKAFQQINVTDRKWKMVPATSMMMGMAEVFITGTIAAVFLHADDFDTKLYAGLTLGCAGALGATVSMWLHGKLEARNRTEDSPFWIAPDAPTQG